VEPFARISSTLIHTARTMLHPVPVRHMGENAPAVGKAQVGGVGGIRMPAIHADQMLRLRNRRRTLRVLSTHHGM